MLAQARIQRHHNLLENKKWILTFARMTTWAASVRFLHARLRQHDKEDKSSPPSRPAAAGQSLAEALSMTTASPAAVS